MLITLFRVRNIRMRGHCGFSLNVHGLRTQGYFYFWRFEPGKKLNLPQCYNPYLVNPQPTPSPTIFSCWPVTITYLSAFDSLKLGKALYLSNSLTASKCPDAQLQCSAVIPSLSWWSTSAPCSINTVINFTNPPWAAHCSGVRLQNTQTNRYARALKRFPGLEPRPLVYRNSHVITDEKV